MIELAVTHYAWIKALHVISVIFWMAGMLYLPRLFVYHMDAAPGGELETALLKQERRLLKIIVNPAMVAAWTFAIVMLIANSALLKLGWVHVKLVLVVALSGLHGYYARAVRLFAAGGRPGTARQWRILNEAPALGVVAIVILAIVKPLA